MFYWWLVCLYSFSVYSGCGTSAVLVVARLVAAWMAWGMTAGCWKVMQQKHMHFLAYHDQLPYRATSYLVMVHTRMVRWIFLVS
jgi:hypothetical protein